MATRTASVSGNWSETATWGGQSVPANGDTVIINQGVEVLFDVDQSAWANGLASITLNGLLHFDSSPLTLKMNGNITGNGSLIIGYFSTLLDYYGGDWVEVEGYDNVYVLSIGGSPQINKVYGKIGDGIIEYTQVDTIEEVENTVGSSFIHRTENSLSIYVNPLDESIDIRFIDPIPRPEIGSESRCQILFNATGTINIPTIIIFGWHPEREFTTLATNSNKNTNTLVLTENLDLQEGDIIVVGSGEDYSGYLVESETGRYTVSSYNSETKTITLTANLSTNRLTGDYIGIYSRPIKVSRTSGTAFLNPTSNVVSYAEIIGARFTTRIFQIIRDLTDHVKFSHTTFSAPSYPSCSSIYNIKVEDCVVGYYASIVEYPVGIEGYIENSLSISSPFLSNCSTNFVIDGSITQNYAQSPYNSSKLKIFNSKNLNTDAISGASFLKNCEITLSPTYYDVVVYSEAFRSVMVDCIISTFNGTIPLKSWIAYNCIFPVEIREFARPRHNLAPYEKCESFDHNCIPGDYRAIMKGGVIGTNGTELLMPYYSGAEPLDLYWYQSTDWEWINYIPITLEDGFIKVTSDLAGPDKFGIYLWNQIPVMAEKEHTMTFNLKGSVESDAVVHVAYYSDFDYTALSSETISLGNISTTETEVSATFTPPANAVSMVISIHYGTEQDPGESLYYKSGSIKENVDNPGVLVFNCQSATSPVFIDFPVTLAPYKRNWWYASAKKDFDGGLVKMELIDPSNDPLIDPSATPIATYTLDDEKDLLLGLKVKYTSNRHREAIVRISAMNSTGTVEINTKWIQRRVRYGR